MEFFAYEKCDKLTWTSNECCRNKYIISKQVIPKSNMNIKYNSPTLGFDCSPHKYTCDIFQNIFSRRLQLYSSTNEVGVLRYIYKVKSIHGIVLTTTFGFKHCG